MNLTIGLAIALALSVLANGVLGKLYIGAREELAAEKQAFSSFKATTKELGDKAATEAERQKKADKIAKETADAENAVTVAGLNRAVERLRGERNRAGGGVVPAAPAATSRPELAAFDRAELDRTVRNFEEGVEGLVIEGAKAVVDLDTARRWAGVK